MTNRLIHISRLKIHKMIITKSLMECFFYQVQAEDLNNTISLYL
jgi:hypothetical protein